ncbi:MAG: class I tRNA ligase family protein, partial [Oscillospiraceae bacterium]
IAVGKLYDFVWDVFCDWYIELAKPRLNAGGEEARATRQVLVYVLTRTLALLHPFMPFITEEIWQSLPHTGESLMVSEWPKADPALDFSGEEFRFEMVMAAIKAIRMARANADVPPSRKSTVYLKSAHADVFVAAAPFMERLAFASSIVPIDEHAVIEHAVHVVTDEAQIFLPMDELIDRDKELARLNRELAACEREIMMVSGRLANESFVQKAPAKVIAGEREKLQKATERVEKIKESLLALA